MSDELIIDATNDHDLLSLEAFQALEKLYWVCAYKHKQDEVSWFDWVFSSGEPRPVPNPDMHWRRPTYAEALSRHRASIERPDFIELCQKYDKSKYATRKNNNE